MFKKRTNNSRRDKNVKKCKKCKLVYTTEKDRVCITCKSKAWLNTRPNSK
jgi:hypothetical protein